MELYVKMTDKEYEEYQDYIKHKEEYVKIDAISLSGIIDTEFEIVSKERSDLPIRSLDVRYRHKRKRIDLFVRYYE
jgi:hypothetical protein